MTPNPHPASGNGDVIEQVTDAVLERLEHLFIGANRVIASDIVDTVLRAGLLKLSEGSEELPRSTGLPKLSEADKDFIRKEHPYMKDSFPTARSEGSGDGKMRSVEEMQEFTDLRDLAQATSTPWASLCLSFGEFGEKVFCAADREKIVRAIEALATRTPLIGGRHV